MVFRWKNFLDYLPPKKTNSVVSKLQDQFDKGAFTPEEFFDLWDAEMGENERLHPGCHDRFFEKLMAMYPGPGIDADEFFGQ